MLMAWEDTGIFKIGDIPSDEARVGANPIGSYSKAVEILAWAKNERRDAQWKIEGKGPYRVCAPPH
jgi:hypothetical protein